MNTNTPEHVKKLKGVVEEFKNALIDYTALISEASKNRTSKKGKTFRYRNYPEIKENILNKKIIVLHAYINAQTEIDKIPKTNDVYLNFEIRRFNNLMKSDSHIRKFIHGSENNIKDTINNAKNEINKLSKGNSRGKNTSRSLLANAARAAARRGYSHLPQIHLSNAESAELNKDFLKISANINSISDFPGLNALPANASRNRAMGSANRHYAKTINNRQRNMPLKAPNSGV